MKQPDRTTPWSALFAFCAVSTWILTPLRAAADEAAWVARINGVPTFTRAGKTEPLQRGATVSTGDVIETNGAAKVKILLADDSVLAIGPSSRVRLDELVLAPQRCSVRLEVLAGRFKIAIAKLLSGSSTYEIRTPTAVAGVRGTILWGDTDLDAVCALDGTIEVRALKGGAAAHLTAGECVHQMTAGVTAPFKPSAEDLVAYLKEVTLD